jgi:MFS family permease
VRRPSLDAVRGFDRAVYIVAAGQLLNVFGAGLVYPFATIHFHLVVGIALSLVGFGLLIRNVGNAVATTIGGYLADRIGRKPVMVVAMAGNAVTLAAYAFVPEIAALIEPLDAAGAFVGVSALAGATDGLYTPAGQAYIADLTDGTQRDRAYSLLKVGNNVGFGTGFVVGGLLYEFAEVAVFLANGFTSGLFAVALFLLVARIHPGQPDTTFRDSVGDWGAAITKRRVLGLAALNACFAVLYAQMQTTVPIVAEGQLGLSSAEIGTLYVLNPLTLVLFQIPLVDAVSGWRRTRGLVVSTGFWAVSMLAVWFVYVADFGPAPAGRHPLLAVGVALVGAHLVTRTLGEVLHSPISTSLMSALGSDGERGAQLSMLEVAKRAGMGIGSFAGGLFFDYGLAPWLWPTLAGLSVVLGVGLLAFERTLSATENGVTVSG